MIHNMLRNLAPQANLVTVLPGREHISEQFVEQVGMVLLIIVGASCSRMSCEPGMCQTAVKIKVFPCSQFAELTVRPQLRSAS